ncbi:response regulator [Paracoccus fontiphilus]|uniref:Response regulator transcription factor n=1 Tax=Paracoccus fontiphilus TaxID=1815556 RepID=A0ABV7IL33_9RHOB|nr:response regulator transcription factor [Paracoccus fontiphilus]
MSRHRVLVADDHPLFRKGVARTLAESGRFEVMGTAASGAEAVDQAARRTPEMILRDLSMPQSGLGALDRIARHELPPVIVTLTVSEDSDAVLAALEEGARGYLLKGIGGAELVAILDRPMAGESRVAPALAARMLTRMHRFRATPPDPLETVVRPPVVTAATMVPALTAAPGLGKGRRQHRHLGGRKVNGGRRGDRGPNQAAPSAAILRGGAGLMLAEGWMCPFP